MGAFSPFHWIILLIVGAIFVIPSARILQRAGFSPWLGLLYFIPLVNIIFLWVFAFMRWPRDDAAASKP